MITPKQPSAYGQLHERFHTPLRDFVNRHGLYDLFLVNKQGRVVYTVFKELDFATSLKNGPWATSNKELLQIVQIITDIGEKTKVINDIVFQTKLLSFNASVEAARAGEHGKGFAVVAEEVGNLAQMSGNAATQITEMLSGSIGKVNSIVDTTRVRVDQLVDAGRSKIAHGQSTAQKCRDALTKIAESAQAVSTMVGEITHASREQSQGIQEINKAIAQLDSVTQQNASVAQRSSDQAQELNTQAADLSRAVTDLVAFVTGAAPAESVAAYDGESDSSASSSDEDSYRQAA